MEELIKDLNKSERISFPVTFELKVIMDATIPDEVNISNIVTLLGEIGIPNEFIRSRLSTGGRYMGFTFKVTLDDHPTLKQLYDRLKSVPGIKFAL